MLPMHGGAGCRIPWWFAATGVAALLLAGCATASDAPQPSLSASPAPTQVTPPRPSGTTVRETGGSTPTPPPAETRSDSGAEESGSDDYRTDDYRAEDSRNERGRSSPIERQVALRDDDDDDDDDGSTTDGGSSNTESAQGAEYTWQDGEHTRRVRLQIDLVAELTDQVRSDDIVAAERGEQSIVRKTDRHQEGGGEPVFRSEFGQLMTLPGGVLLALDPDWDSARINRFFSGQGIAMSRAQPHVFAVNGFLVETEPGFPSLDLANSLAGQEGVILSVPNWQREIVER